MISDIISNRLVAIVNSVTGRQLKVVDAQRQEMPPSLDELEDLARKLGGAVTLKFSDGTTTVVKNPEDKEDDIEAQFEPGGW